MGQLKKLAGQTAIYGLPTIVGRLLNYFLVPLYTRTLIESQYGVVTDFYAYIALFMVLLTYGMETAFFRYAQKNEKYNDVYSTAFTSLLISSSAFLLLCVAFRVPIASVFGYASHSEYIAIVAAILALDALRAIPFALLRQQQRPIRFAVIKTIEISANIFFNLFFLVVCPLLLSCGNPGIEKIVTFVYNPENKVLYIFLSNLLASLISFVFLAPEFLQVKLNLNRKLWAEMFFYAFPIMLGSLAGILNEVFDRMVLKYLIPDAQNPMAQLGIYGACYKISIIMTLFIQAFRFAAEPFFFQRAKHQGAQQTYAVLMKYFIIVCSIIFLTVMLYIDVVMLFVGEKFRVGITVVPILLLANWFLGIYYNLSVWYKLTDKVIFGAIIGFVGAGITIALNFLLIPLFGYVGSAYATLACYTVMMVVSFIFGQKYYPIPYKLSRNLLYIIFPVIIFSVSFYLPFGDGILRYVFNTILLLAYIAGIYIFELKKDLKTKVL